MKIRELFEDQQVKSKVIRALSKTDDQNPIFANIYKLLVGSPLATRLEKYLQHRGDPDAVQAKDYLNAVIPKLGNVDEIKAFLTKLNNGEDFVNLNALVPKQSMPQPESIGNLITDPFAAKLFANLYINFAGKNDAGPGEGALSVLSPNITYGKPGDIVVGGSVKVEVKGAKKAAGKSGRIWDLPIHQKPMLDILAKAVPGAGSFSVLDGNKPFPVPELSKNFISAACRAWFGKPIPAIIASFGTPEFAKLWQAQVFDVYKAHGQWDGMLALGVRTYQYVRTGEEFAMYMGKANQGSLCRAGAKQSRELAPQVLIK